MRCELTPAYGWSVVIPPGLTEISGETRKENGLVFSKGTSQHPYNRKLLSPKEAQNPKKTSFGIPG